MAKRTFNSANLLGLNTTDHEEVMKRRRKDIETSLGFMGDSPNLPKIHDYLETAIRLSKTIADFHTVLEMHPAIPGDYSKMISTALPLPRQKINPFAFAQADLKPFGVDTARVFDPIYEKPLNKDSDLTVAKILGSAQRDMLFSSIIEASSIDPIYTVATKPLCCQICNASSFDGKKILTVAEERGRECQHPSRGKNVAWAIDEKTGAHPFSSRPTAIEGEREGDGVCFSCLYEHIIMADEMQKQCLVQWNAFELLMMDNAGDLMDLDGEDDKERSGIFCSCQYHNRGVICLFRFSLVLTSKVVHDNERSPDELTALERAESIGYATYDTRDHARLNSIYKSVCFEPIHANNDTGLKDLSTNLSLAAYHIQQDISDLSNSMLHGHMGGTLDLKNPHSALSYILSVQPIMDKYYTAMEALINSNGNQILLLRDSSEQAIEICDCCGGYGHSSSKMCYLRTDPNITPRAGMKLGEHFAENIRLATQSQVSALQKTIDLHRWEDKQLIQHFQDLGTRTAQGQLARRDVPSKFFLTKCEAGKGRQKKTLMATPSVSIQAFASLTPEEAQSAIHIDMFTNRNDTETIRKAWASMGFDTSDFALNDAWLDYARQNGLDNSNLPVADKIEALHSFARVNAQVIAPPSSSSFTLGSATNSTSSSGNGSPQQ